MMSRVEIVKLAHLIYNRVLNWRDQNRSRKVAIYYTDVCTELHGAWPDLFPDLTERSSELNEALGYICERCRAKGLPLLPAIVWNAWKLRPGDGYPWDEHGEGEPDDEDIAKAWRAEVAKVWRAAYPAALP